MDWNKVVVRLWPWMAAALSGLLYAGCFAPFNQTWLCWLALTPLICALWFSGTDGRRAWLRHLLLGYVAGVVFFTAGFNWLGSLGVLFDNIFLHTLPFLLSTYLALYLAAWSVLIGWMRPGDFAASHWNLLAAISGASGWVALEWMRGWIFGGFNWNGIGAALHNQWPMIQVVEYTGVAGLSFVIVLVNVIAVTTPIRLFIEARRHKMRLHWDLNLTMLAVIGLYVFGWHTLQSPIPTRPFPVAAVQPSVPQNRKLDPEFRAAIFDKLSRLSTQALQSMPSPSLLIWPESALPDPMVEGEESYGYVMDLSTSAKTDLLLGGDIEEDDNLTYNAALLIKGADQTKQIYRKIHLVAFGEFVPLRHSFPPFGLIAGKWVPGDFNFGWEYIVLHPSDPQVHIAPLICFEDTIGELTRQFVLKGANLLVNITNDGWFLESGGSQQHLANAIFRCIETRRPMVRAANTGVTCFINELGRVTKRLQDEKGATFGEGMLAGEVNVPTEPKLTFYVQHGELFAKWCAAVAVILIVVRGALIFVDRALAQRRTSEKKTSSATM